MFEEKIEILNKTKKEKRSYSVAEVEKILGVARPTVYKLIQRGCFKGIKVGHGYRIIKDSFDNWIDGNGGI